MTVSERGGWTRSVLRKPTQKGDSFGVVITLVKVCRTSLKEGVTTSSPDVTTVVVTDNGCDIDDDRTVMSFHRHFTSFTKTLPIDTLVTVKVGSVFRSDIDTV